MGLPDGTNEDHYQLKDGRKQVSRSKVSQIDATTTRVEFGKDIVLPSDAPPATHVPFMNASAHQLLSSKAFTDTSGAITISGHLESSSTNGILKITARIKVEGVLPGFSDWSAAFQTDFEAEAQACDSAALKLSLENTLTVKAGSNADTCVCQVLTGCTSSFKACEPATPGSWDSCNEQEGGTTHKLTGNVVQCAYNWLHKLAQAVDANQASCALGIDGSLEDELNSVCRNNAGGEILQHCWKKSALGTKSRCSNFDKSSFLYHAENFCNHMVIPLGKKEYTVDLLEQVSGKLGNAAFRASEIAEQSKSPAAMYLAKILKLTGSDIVLSVVPDSIKTSFTGVQFAVRLHVYVLKISELGVTLPCSYGALPGGLLQTALNSMSGLVLYEQEVNLIQLVESIAPSVVTSTNFLTQTDATDSGATGDNKIYNKDSADKPGRTFTMGTMTSSQCSTQTPAFEITLIKPAEGSVTAPSEADVAKALSASLSKK